MRKKKKGKLKVILLVLLLFLVGAAGAAFHFDIPIAISNMKVYVENVGDIAGLGSGNGGQNRYAGVVESQDILNISLNADKTVKEVYVKEGDVVKVGDKLFAYDNEEAELNLAQAKLELERMENEIKAGEAEIANLEKEKKNASSSAQIEYTIQIQSQKALNKKTEYEMKSQKAKITSLEKATKNSVVKCEMAGVVKKINQSAISDSTELDDYSDDSIFMSILATGDYRVKATINEQNQWTIEEGKEVIVRSRIDENATWKGKITTVDTENPETVSTDAYADSGDMTLSSKYPFYVELDSSEGLILGQHVYIEPDEGQDDLREGLWLDSYYIMEEKVEKQTEEGSTGETSLTVQNYVWAKGILGLLEKREITLGEYNEELDQYEIVSGITGDDYIAFPQDGLKEGLRTTTNIEDILEEETGDEGLESGEESFEYEDEEIFQEFEDEDGIIDEEDAGEDGAVGSIEWDLEVLL